MPNTSECQVKELDIILKLHSSTQYHLENIRIKCYNKSMDGRKFRKRKEMQTNE